MAFAWPSSTLSASWSPAGATAARSGWSARPGSRPPSGRSCPMIRSPSQCPGTARSSTSAGRSEIMTMSGICPRRCGLPGAGGRPAHCAGSGPAPAQLAPALDVEGLVDRLVAHPHHRIVWEVDAQAAGDLLGRPQLLEPALDLATKRGQAASLDGLGRRARSSAPGSRPRPDSPPGPRLPPPPG